jgi:hypothetical protein
MVFVEKPKALAGLPTSASFIKSGIYSTAATV